jgi:hypothetical protein
MGVAVLGIDAGDLHVLTVGGVTKHHGRELLGVIEPGFRAEVEVLHLVPVWTEPLAVLVGYSASLVSA